MSTPSSVALLTKPSSGSIKSEQRHAMAVYPLQCNLVSTKGSVGSTPLIQFVQVTTNWKRSLPNRIEKGKKGKEQKLKTRTFLRRRAGHWPMTGIGSGRWPESVTLAHPPSNPPNTTNYQPRPANHL